MDKRIKLAKTLIIVGSLFSLVPYFWLFSLPIYLIGVVVLITTKLHIKQKLIWTLGPIVVLVLWTLALPFIIGP